MLAALAAVAVPMVVGAGSATATTFCVPTFSAACPNSEGNVAEPDLEKAMGLQGTDGVADQIVVAAGTLTESNAFEPAGGSGESFEPNGSDPLTIVGAGPAATILTGTGTGNVYLVNLSFNNSRKITIRDLTLRVPASFPDGLGAAILLYNGDTLDNVDIVSLNDDSDGVVVSGPGNVFRNGELRGEGANGAVEDALSASNSGTLLAEDATVKGASWALVASATGALLTARRVSVVGARTYGAIATNGSLLVENSKMTIDDGIGLFASAGADPSVLNADHVTIVDSGGNDPAIEGKKFSGTAGDATISVTNSILRGFGSGYKTDTPFGPGIGLVSIKARYSNLSATGSSTGGTVDIATGPSTGNIDVDPLLTADLSLPPGSPSIDAGDPAVGGLTTDFIGAPRPVDGNGDGVARRDQGAFEYQPPPVLSGPSGETPDTTPPDTKIVRGPSKAIAKGIAKFRFKSSETGSRFECKLDRKKATRCKSPRRYGHLKPGWHTFKVWAIDAAGNKDPTPAKRRFKVPS